MRWITGAILVLFVALAMQLPLLAYAMYVLLAIIGASHLLAHSWSKNVSAERECSRLEAEVGDSVAVIVTVRNDGMLPIAWLLVEDLLPRHALIHNPPSLKLAGRRIQLQMLWSNANKRVMYQLTCNRRGYYQIGPLVVETGDVFGLHRRFRVVTEPSYLMVLPRVVPLEGFDIASRRPIGEVRMSYRLYEDPTRIAGVRDYQPGDALNRIHWHATARTGALHSKIYEPSTVAGATVLLEFHTDSHDTKDEPLRSELAVTAAASVANAVYEMGQQVGLITNGRDAADRVRVEGWDYDPQTRSQARSSASMKEQNERLQPVIVPTRRGPEQLTRILETLARVELTDGLTLPELISESAGRLPRDATVITFLPKVTSETVIALHELRKRGFAVSAILNIHEEYDFADASGPLESVGIDTHHLKNEQTIPFVCQRFLMR